MENNENNVQNEVNNANSAQSNKPKKGKGKTVALIIIIMILMLLIGLGAGCVLSNQKLFDNILGKNNQTQESNDKNEEEVKTSKKIDESKPWVYDAEYGYGKSAKTITNNLGTVYNSTDELIVPYINVNSEYAKSVNEELKTLFEKEYNAFGGAYPDLQISEGYLPKIQYQFSVYNDILSLYVQKFTSVINGDGSVKYYTYNINLKTLEKASLADVYTAAGFSSENYFKESVENTITNEIAEGNLVEEDVKLDYKLFFLDKNKVFNLVLTSPSGNPGAYPIVPGTEKKISTTNQVTTTSTENVDKNSYAKEYIKIIDEVAAEYPDSNLTCDLIYFNNDNIPDLVIGISGYWVSLYVYENGTVYNPIDNWAYGAMGNTGYDYLERKGAVYNYNSDYAGGIGTTSIAVYNSKHGFDYLAHRDKGADIDGTDPDLKEMYEEVQKDLERTAGYYYNDKKISEQEYNDKVKELSVSTNVNDYKGLDGSKTTEEIKNQLQK